MCWHEIHPPRLINAATLPCESRKTENTYEVMNTTSSFNVNYKIAVTCIKLH